MDITRPNLPNSAQTRSSRSRVRHTGSSSRGQSASRRPSSQKRSLSNSSSHRPLVVPTHFDLEYPVPSVQATLDNSLPSDFFKQDVIAMIKLLKVSKWHKKELKLSSLSIQRISGALTNSIYKIEYQDQELSLPSLLLRVYGKNVDYIIDRDFELNVLVKLSQRNIGPKLLGTFSNGRLEQFLEGFSPLNKETIRKPVISQMLGRRMKDLHYQIEVDSLDCDSSLPMSWRLIHKWLDIFEREIYPTYKPSIKDEDVFIVDFATFKELIYKYKKWLFSHYEGSELSPNYKFCHNDTQYGNLLLHESFDASEVFADMTNSAEMTANGHENSMMKTGSDKDNDLAVIDFEYSGPNFPAMDIANHFSEWMADYHDPVMSYFIHEDKYPSRLEQLNLIKSYVEYDFRYPTSSFKVKREVHPDSHNPSEVARFEVEKLYNECVVWRPTVQIYWCMWGLIQNGPIKRVSSFLNLNLKQGIDSTYSFNAEPDSTSPDNVVTDDQISSEDDDFDYLKYSNQKCALVMGDLIQHNLINEGNIDETYRDRIKYLDCSLYNI